MQSVADLARAYSLGRKERLRERAAHGLLVIREGRVTAVLSHRDVAPLLAQARLAGAAYGADALALVVEGTLPVGDLLLIAIGARDGAISEEAWGFELTATSVKWAEQPQHQSSGGLAAALAARLNGEALDPGRVPDPGDGMVGDAENGPFYDAAYGRVALDVGCTRSLGGRLDGGEVILVAESAAHAAYLVGEGLPSWQVEVG